jgi:GNAT superfamily N-acetyltransferase
MDDLDTLLHWRNDPETVKWSLNNDHVYPEVHARWLEKALSDPDKEILIGVCNATPVGVVRFDTLKVDDGDKIFVSITVAPEVRGRGFGKLILEAGGLRKRDHNLSAIINRKNNKSLCLFEGLGYAEVGKFSSKDFLILNRGPLLI